MTWHCVPTTDIYNHETREGYTCECGVTKHEFPTNTVYVHSLWGEKEAVEWAKDIINKKQ